MHLPGNRGPSTDAEVYYIQKYPLFCLNNSKECLRVATGNALHAVSRASVARAMLSKGPIHAKDLAGVACFIQTEMGWYCLRKAGSQNEDADEWIVRQRSGVYLLRLIGVDQDGDEVGRVIATDCNRSLMLGVEEAFALRLYPRVFDMCVGDGADFIAVEKVRRLHRNPIAQVKKTRTRRKRKKINRVDM